MIRAGRFFAVVLGDGYEIHDDVRGLVSRTYCGGSWSSRAREASGEVAQRHHEQHRTMQEVTP